jgi:hypothetical protein
MLETGKIDLVNGRANAESISAMLMAFPHLIPNSTNLWLANVKREPATDTLADAAIWESRSFFNKEAMAKRRCRAAARLLVSIMVLFRNGIDESVIAALRRNPLARTAQQAPKRGQKHGSGGLPTICV